MSSQGVLTSSMSSFFGFRKMATPNENNNDNCLNLKKVDTFGSNTESENEEKDKNDQGVQPRPRRV